jgi:hypothetical protein
MRAFALPLPFAFCADPLRVFTPPAFVVAPALSLYGLAKLVSDTHKEIPHTNRSRYNSAVRSTLDCQPARQHPPAAD